MSTFKAGYTLVELLVLIAVVSVLIAAVGLALNPAKRFQESRDARRSTDVQSISEAIAAHRRNNNDRLPTTINALAVDTPAMIGTETTSCHVGCSAVATQTACTDLTSLALDGFLEGGVPKDPAGGTAAKTDYYIIRHADDTVTVGACDTEGGTSIKMTR